MRGAGSGAAAIALLASLQTVGCVTYRAPIQREIRRGEVSVLVQQASGHPNIRGSAEIDVAIRDVPHGVRLLGASISGFPQSFCSGLPASKLGREQGRGAGEPLVAGERLSFEFHPAALTLLSLGAPRLDLDLRTARGARRCVSLPLSPPGERLRFEPKQRFTLGLDLSLEGFTAGLGPVTQVAVLPIQLGVWIDHYHLEAGAGIAGAGCPDTSCPRPSESSRIDYATAIPLFAGARFIAYEHGEISLGAALRYRAIHLVADTYDGRRSFWMHGPVFAPYIGAGMPYTNVGSEMGGAREALVALEIPVGYAFAEHGLHSLSVGANVVMMFTVF